MISLRQNLKRMKKTLIFISTIFVALASQAQDKAHVVFHTAALDSLVTYSNKFNYATTSLDGYRIQVYSGSGASARNDSQNAKRQVLEAYPSERTYGTYNAPSWRVRVGDFRFRSEAMPLLSKLRRQFPGCYIVKDKDVKKKTFVE